MATASRDSGPVRVSMPASVAADIGSLKKAIGTVLGKLGCPACCSGNDILIELQRDIVLRKDLKAPAEVTGAPTVALQAKRNTLRVGMAPRLAANIDDVFVAIDRIAELSGHTACATGCDIFFNLERNFVIDARLGIEEQALTLG